MVSQVGQAEQLPPRAGRAGGLHPGRPGARPRDEPERISLRTPTVSLVWSRSTEHFTILPAVARSCGGFWATAPSLGPLQVAVCVSICYISGSSGASCVGTPARAARNRRFQLRHPEGVTPAARDLGEQHQVFIQTSWHAGMADTWWGCRSSYHQPGHAGSQLVAYLPRSVPRNPRKDVSRSRARLGLWLAR